MIEINLLPGTGKKKASRGSGGAKLDLAATFSGFSGSIKDKFLAAAVISVVVAVAGIATLYTTQERRADDLADRDKKAIQDSTHYAGIMAEKVRFEAKRDTLLRQLNIIRSIDGDRYIWPHVLDEVSRALPAYTWLTDVAYTGTAQGISNVVALPAANAKGADAKKTEKKKDARLQTEIPQDSVHVKVEGRTADIQALTRFMKDLEASPFLANVQLEKSEMVIEAGEQITQFSLTMTYTRPDSTVIRRVALADMGR